MQEAKTSLEFRGYCTQCRSGFFSIPRGPRIECDTEHQLAKNFPYHSFWNYCCGCDVFYPSNGYEGKEAESNCLCCERPINRRFFCNSCNLMTLDDPKLEAFMADKTTIEPGEQVRLWALVTDADGDSPIYYDWRASAGDIQNKNETAILTTSGINTPEIIIFLTVADNRGGQTSQRLFVKVRNTPLPAASPSPSPVPAKANDDH